MVWFQFGNASLNAMYIGLQVRYERSIWELEILISNWLYKKIYKHIVLLNTIRSMFQFDASPKNSYACATGMLSQLLIPRWI